MSSKLERMGAIIKQIANEPGVTLGGLRERLAASGIEITERTLAKDIDSLKREYGLLPDEGRMRRGYFLSGLASLGATELNLTIEALGLLATRMDDPEAERVLERLVALRRELPGGDGAAQAPARTVRQRNVLAGGRDYQETIEKLYDAIHNHRCLDCTYKTPRLEAELQFSGYPLLMVFHERGWYCIFRAAEAREYKARRVDRIKKLESSAGKAVNTAFEEETTEASYLLNCGWGMSFPKNMEDAAEIGVQPAIVARFDSTIAGYILEATDRHPRGKVAALRDGTGDVEFQIKLDPVSTDAFVDWIRSFGSKARIVAPPSLVDKERAEVRRLLSRYDA